MAEGIPYPKRTDAWPLLTVDDMLATIAEATRFSADDLSKQLDFIEQGREAERQKRLDAPLVIDGVEIEAGGWYDVIFEYNVRPTRGIYVTAIKMAAKHSWGWQETAVEERRGWGLHFGANPKAPHSWPKGMALTEGSRPRDIRRVEPNKAQLAALAAYEKRQKEFEESQAWLEARRKALASRSE